jgi:hypothetical protein
MVKGTFLENFPKNHHILRKEKSFEIANIFGGLGKISSVLLLKSP